MYVVDANINNLQKQDQLNSKITERKIQTLSEKLKAQTDENSSLQKQFDVTKSQLQETESRLAAVQNELSQAQNERSQTQNELSQTQNELSQAQKVSGVKISVTLVTPVLCTHC